MSGLRPGDVAEIDATAGPADLYPPDSPPPSVSFDSGTRQPTIEEPDHPEEGRFFRHFKMDVDYRDKVGPICYHPIHEFNWFLFRGHLQLRILWPRPGLSLWFCRRPYDYWQILHLNYPAAGGVFQ
jgi:hypothetical protein